MKLTLAFSKETKNTFVFTGPETTLYVPKSVFPNGAPTKITVTLEAAS
jgi:hypothetical protein